MMNGAITLGTLDGANVEICQAVGEDNMFLFGMRTDEVEALRRDGYDPRRYYENNETIRHAVDVMFHGFDGHTYSEIAGSLLGDDRYMALADFADYSRAQAESAALYRDTDAWAKKALLNTAASGIFASDRSIRDYNERIWHAKAVK